MQDIMLTKRLFIYVLLASSLLLNGWTWFNSPNSPQLDKIVLRYPVENLGVVYGVSTNGGGATVGFSYRYYLSKSGSNGRSALLLSKAKDNNASTALGPFVRLFDETFNIDDVRAAEVALRVVGKDGFVMDGSSSMNQISRDPLDQAPAWQMGYRALLENLQGRGLVEAAVKPR
ncbi:MAG: fumarylacetoacetate hydrolase [Pseudomonas sp.]|nr:fumarylacetoacetate hydrolase [Pseudomonas sp.]